MTEPLNYATPVDQKETPLVAWISIVVSAIAFVFDVLGLIAERGMTNRAVVTTGNGTTYVSTTTVISPLPIWMNILRVLVLVLPLIGLTLAIVAMRRANTNKAAAIVGIALNALLLAGLLLIA